jgi:protein SPA2
MSDDNYASSISSRRKPSQDTTRRSEDRDREYGRRPSAAASMSANSDSTTTAAQSTMATSGMIIPNTSTMEEEYIEVPFGRDARESGSSINDERERSRDRGPDSFSTEDDEPDSASHYASPMSPNSPAVGLSGLSARLKVDEDDEPPSARSGDDFYDKASSYGRNSVNSDRSISNRLGGGRASVSEDHGKMRRDYEFRIATMQTQITNLQRDVGDSQQTQSKLENSETRVRQLEEELVTVLRNAEEQTSAMRALQKELDELRETRQREKERETRRAREDEEELQILRDRLEKLEEERADGRGGVCFLFI